MQDADAKPAAKFRWGPVLTFSAAGAFAILAVVRWQSTPRPVAVSGVVRLNGVPLERGVVNFRAEDDAGSYAMGSIGRDGRYTAESPHLGPGILPGTYRVGVLAQEDPSKYTPEEYNALVGIGKPGIPSIIPRKMTDPATSDLRVTVVAPGPQTFDFNLETQSETSDSGH
jgi:hypothetical protein